MRTKKSLQNMLSTIILTLIIGIIGFVKVKVFINGLSDDIYSLNQLFGQILSYITITDAGFGLILNKQLYQAFAKEDFDEINRIYNTSRKFYIMIGNIMIFLAIVISFFVQYLTKAQISNGYIQIIFLIFIVRNVIDYYFVAPRYVLEADQKIYKVNVLLKGTRILESIIEIILVILGVDYLIILLPGIILTILFDIVINRKIYKMYPWLTNENSFNKNYLKGTKDIIWRKGADLLNSNTDIILISTFIDPLSVVIYTSYIYITKFVTDVVYMVSYSITPSFANALLKENNDKSYNIFNEINMFFLFLASFVFIMFYGFLSKLIILWVGEKYLVTNFVLFLFCFSTFQIIAEKPIQMIINCKGLFKETKTATIIEALLNLVLSLALIHKYKIIGVLIGTIVSKFLTSFIQNPIYIFKNIFKKNVVEYYRKYFIVFLINILFVICFNILEISGGSLISFIVNVLIYSVVVGLTLVILFYLIFKAFRNLLVRGIEFIKVKGRYNE